MKLVHEQTESSVSRYRKPEATRRVTPVIILEEQPIGTKLTCDLLDRSVKESFSIPFLILKTPSVFWFLVSNIRH